MADSSSFFCSSAMVVSSPTFCLYSSVAGSCEVVEIFFVTKDINVFKSSFDKLPDKIFDINAVPGSLIEYWVVTPLDVEINFPAKSLELKIF